MYSKDIAKLAGVSRSTVSRVVNNYSNVQPETREKVNRIIKEKFRVYQNVYISPFEAAIIDYGDKLGYNVLALIINDDNDFDKIRNLFNSKILSGGIFLGANNNSREIFDLIESGYKMAVIDQEKKQGRKAQNYIIVNSDNYSGAYKATKHLIDYGHTEIAHICGDMNKYSGFKRLEGYKKAMSEIKLKNKGDYIFCGDFTEESGFECVIKLLKDKTKNKITAIFSSNDTMAIGAMKALKKMKIRIPEDISIVGYDDIRIASYVSPTLTTVRSSITEMASVATGNLIDFIENDINSSRYFTIPAELVVRESTRKK